MAGLYEALTFPFAICFGFNARAIAAERKRLMDDVEAPEDPKPSAVSARATVAESIAAAEKQIQSLRETIEHEEKQAAKKEAEARRLIAEGREKEARHVVASRVNQLQMLQQMRERITGFETKLGQLRLNAMNETFAPVLQAMVEATSNPAAADAATRIVDLHGRLKDGLENGRRVSIAINDAARDSDVILAPDGQSAISVTEEVDREMQRLLQQQPISVPYSPAPPARTSYIPGAAPEKPKPASAAVKRVQIV